MDPIYLDGEDRAPAPYNKNREYSDSENEGSGWDMDEEEDVDQLASDSDLPEPSAQASEEPAPAPAAPPRPAGEELEPSDDEDAPGGARLKGWKPLRTSGVPLFSEQRVTVILEENGAAQALSKEATFVLSIATEEFIRRYIQAGNDHAQARNENRNIIQYGDMAASTSLRCFSMLEDVVPTTRTLRKATELREKFLKRQRADNPALIDAPHEAPPAYDASAPLVPYPTDASTPWTATPNGVAAGGSKRTKSAPRKERDPAAPGRAAGKSAAATARAGADAENEAEQERRASARQRDRAGRYSLGEQDAPPGVAAGASSASAAPAANGSGSAFGPFGGGPGDADGGAPFATNTGRTIYSQR